MKDNKNEKEY